MCLVSVSPSSSRPVAPLEMAGHRGPDAGTKHLLSPTGEPEGAGALRGRPPQQLLS